MVYLKAGQSPLTLHIRLTKGCNADCSYCSSYEPVDSDRMSIIQLKESLEWIVDEIWPAMGLRVGALTIEYVGGELLTLPSSYLEGAVTLAREIMRKRGIPVHDGAQSNLIGSGRKIDVLHRLFGNRISTSIDSSSGQRTIKGSPDTYQTFFRQGDQHLTDRLGNISPGAVITVDGRTQEHTLAEIQSAIADGRNITVRPVFSGGMPVEEVGNQSLKEIYEKSFELWAMKDSPIIEPFFSLSKKRLATAYSLGKGENLEFCPHQSNCAERSLSLEPNGDLYVCQDMADSKEYPIGNTLQKRFDAETWAQMARRPTKLSMDCYTCSYFQACQGGCMLQAVQHGHGMWGKSNYCEIWKSLFSMIDGVIIEHGAIEFRKWLNALES